ncbi:MAG: glycerophosphodiester phosphodiesterase [Acidobacteriota bacterium]|nr:glycerophosphodiester phosphodiesterase [Acidobacteriota bacterium]
MKTVVKGRRFKWLLIFLLGGVGVLGAVYGSMALSTGVPAPEHAFFREGARRPLVIAHRGGAGLWPENTLYAFGRAVEMGADVIETDARLTADGALVLFHDETVGRTTDGAGRVSELTLAELKRLDAGYRWSPDGGRTFPFRGRGLTIPTLGEAFARTGGVRFNIEPKHDSDALAGALCAALRGHGMVERVVVGSFSHAALEKFRRACPEVATSASPSEASSFLALYRAGLAGSYSPPMRALQVPEYAGGMQVLTREFVEAAHGRNLHVHAWTVNGVEDMRRLLDIGVDGVMTDYPDRLLNLLQDREP